MFAFEASEREMQAAGRLSSHQYLDLRSAKRAYQKTRKYSRQQSRRDNHCRCCEPPRYNQQRVERRWDNHYALQNRVWEDSFRAERDWEEFMRCMDPVQRFAMLGKWESHGPPGDDGTSEDFGTWGRRRINEMRQCKEERLRRARGKQQQSASSLSTRKHKLELARLPTPDPTPTIPTTLLPSVAFYSSIPTTLPLTSWDSAAHKVLAEVLTLTNYDRALARKHNKSAFRIIRDYYWFGEFGWAYHRNASGCREFGWLWPDEERGCGWNVWLDDCWWNPCSCEEFGGTAPPEEGQSCSLVEWVVGSLWDLMVEEEGREEEDGEDMVVEESEWEIMSDAASHGWSVVSDDEEFDMI